MDEKTIFVFFVVLLVAILAFGIPMMIAITKDINAQIDKCDQLGRWAKTKLDMRQEGEDNGQDT